MSIHPRVPAPCVRTSAFRSARLADAVTAGLCSAAHVQTIAEAQAAAGHQTAATWASGPTGVKTGTRKPTAEAGSRLMT